MSPFDALLEDLQESAYQLSERSRNLAKGRSLKNSHNRVTNLYPFTKPEDTLSGQALTAIRSLLNDRDTLEQKLSEYQDRADIRVEQDVIVLDSKPYRIQPHHLFKALMYTAFSAILLDALWLSVRFLILA